MYLLSKAQPKQLLFCQMVSSDVGMREHPKSRKTSPSVWGGQRNRKANTQILKSELHWPWQETAMGQYPGGCLVAPFIPAEKLQFYCSDHDLCPKRSREAALAGCYVNCAPFACRKPSTGWYGNPPHSTQGCSMRNRLFGEGTGVSVEVETLVPKSMRGRKDPCNHTFIWKIVL